MFLVLVTATAAIALLTRQRAEQAGADQGVSLASESAADGAGGAATQPGLVDTILADPAALFFLGGVVMLVAVTAYWYVTEYR